MSAGLDEVFDAYQAGAKGDRERMLDLMLRDLYRSYPSFSTTMGSCANTECDGVGRGCGPCPECIGECIKRLTDDETSTTLLHFHVKQQKVSEAQLREAVRP